MKTGEILKKLRVESDLTLEELGNRLNPPVQKATILRWESGVIRTIKSDYLNQLASIFNVSMNYLVGSDETLLTEVKLWDSVTALFGSFFMTF